MTPTEKRAHRAHLASQRKSIAAQNRHEKKMLELFKKALRATGSRQGYRTNSSRRSASVTWSGGRSTRGAGTWKSLGKTPPLLLKIHTGGLAGDGYSEKQSGAEFVSSNMLGGTAKHRAREFAIDFARHPMVNPNRLIVHVSLSRPEGCSLSRKEWKQVVENWLSNVGAAGCNFVAFRHTETDNDHCHIIFSRSRPDGALLTDSNNRWAWRSALRKTECDLNLITPEIPRPTEHQVPTSDRMVNAQRRAVRLKLQSGFVEPAVVRSALESSTDLSSFKTCLSACGIEIQEAEKNGRKVGLLFRKIGSGQWLAGSSISRDFSLPQIEKSLSKNFESQWNASVERRKQQEQQAARRHVDASKPTTRERNL
jgi:hypothetical protein